MSPIDAAPPLPQPHDGLDDAELVRCARGGNGAAFAELYRRHVLAVTRYCHRRCGSPHDAADLAAETFAEALLRLERFDPQRGTFRDWAYGIARNKWRRWARTGNVERRARQRLGIRIEPPDDDDADRICAAVDAAGYHRQLNDHLDELPEKLSVVVRLRVLDGASYSHISAELGISEAAARKRLSRALGQLAERLDPSTSHPGEPS